MPERRHAAVMISMRLIWFTMGCATAYHTAIHPHSSPRASRPLCLDVVVPPVTEKKPEEGLRKSPRGLPDDVPEYMKSKRNMYPRKCDVMDEIEDFVQKQIDDGLLLNQDKAWQPHDFLPDSEKPTEEWIDEVREFRKMAADLPDDLLLVLIGDMVSIQLLIHPRSTLSRD